LKSLLSHPDRSCLECWHQWEQGRYKKYVRKECREENVVEYYVLMYENGKMRPVETTPGMGGGLKENDGGVNSTKIYCKVFCKCHNVPPAQ
jgi:hypothetical protein